MIKEILNLLSNKVLTPVEMAMTLGIKLGELDTRLKMMEHLGYIKKVSDEASDCNEGCVFCPMAKSCQHDKDHSSFGTAYFLTETGKRICGYDRKVIGYNS
jgi:hypothetical protein